MPFMFDKGGMIKYTVWQSILVALLLGVVTANEDQQIPYSEAQILLFNKPHLSNIKQPLRLVYNFEQIGKHSFSDFVDAQITNLYQDGTRDVEFTFLSNERQRNYPGVKSFRGNPLIMLFLEWDVETMENMRLVPVSRHYLRNKIRIGFWKHCKVDEVTMTYDNVLHQAKRITMQPFANSQLKNIANKQYEFILIDKVPGELFQATTRWTTDESGFVETTRMTFERIDV